MAITVEMPDGNRIEFPDEMPNADIEHVIRTQYLGQQEITADRNPPTVMERISDAAQSGLRAVGMFPDKNQIRQTRGARAVVEKLAADRRETTQQFREKTLEGSNVSNPPAFAAMGALNMATGGVTGKIFEDVTPRPDTITDKTTEALGSVAGFAVPFGATMKAIGKVPVLNRILATTEGATTAAKIINTSKNVGRMTLGMGGASVLADAANIMDSPGYHQAKAKAVEAAKSGAQMGVVFGVAGAVPGGFTGFKDFAADPYNAKKLAISSLTAAIGNAAMDEITGNRIWDDRPIDRKVFDYGLNTYFLFFNPSGQVKKDVVQKLLQSGKTPQEYSAEVMINDRPAQKMIEPGPNVITLPQRQLPAARAEAQDVFFAGDRGIEPRGGQRLLTEGTPTGEEPFIQTPEGMRLATPAEVSNMRLEAQRRAELGITPDVEEAMRKRNSTQLPPDRELYQFRPGKKDAAGDRWAIVPLTEERFQKFVRPTLPPDYAVTLREYRAKHPEAEYIRLAQKATPTHDLPPQVAGIGKLESLRPGKESGGYVLKVGSFKSPLALDYRRYGTPESHSEATGYVEGGIALKPQPKAPEGQLEPTRLGQPEVPSADTPADTSGKNVPRETTELWQFRPNKEGGQVEGNRLEILPLTEELFQKEVQPTLRKGYAESLAEYQSYHPEQTHVAYIRKPGVNVPTVQSGPLAELRPNKEAAARDWAVQVEGFDHPLAVEYAKKPDSANNVDILHSMEIDLKDGEHFKPTSIQDQETGAIKWYGGGTTNPKWFTDSGLSKVEWQRVLAKAKSGGALTERQAKALETAFPLATQMHREEIARGAEYQMTEIEPQPTPDIADAEPLTKSAEPVVDKPAPQQPEAKATPDELAPHEEEIAKKIRQAPSYPELLAAYKRHIKSIYGDRERGIEHIEEAGREPWRLLTAHAGVMNAKSARAQTLEKLANAVFKETKLPRKPVGKFRGENGVDWDKLTPRTEPKSTATDIRSPKKPRQQEMLGTGDKKNEKQMDAFSVKLSADMEKSGSSESKKYLEREAMKYESPDSFWDAQEKLFHGTDSNIEIFDISKSKWNDKFALWFTRSRNFAEAFGGSVKEAIAILENPKRITSEKWETIRSSHAKDTQWFTAWKKELLSKGYDGLIIEGEKTKLGRTDVETPEIVAVFDSEKVKTKEQVLGIWEKAHKDGSVKGTRLYANPLEPMAGQLEQHWGKYLASAIVANEWDDEGNWHWNPAKFALAAAVFHGVGGTFGKINGHAPGVAAWKLVEKGANNLFLRPGLRAFHRTGGADPAAHELIKDARLHTKRTESEIAKLAQKVAKEFTVDERRQMSDWIEKEGDLGAIADNVKAQADNIKKWTQQIGQQLVDAGMLKPETYAKNKDGYLHRLYEKEMDKPLAKHLRKFMSIKANWSMMRGKYVDLPAADVRKDWKIGDVIYKMQLPGEDAMSTRYVHQSKMTEFQRKGWWQMDNFKVRSIDGKGNMRIWRDWSKAERERMGEERDAVLRFYIGSTAAMRDLFMAQAFQKIAANPKLASDTAVEGWKHVPDTAVGGGSGIKKYGALGGKWVEPGIENAIQAARLPWRHLDNPGWQKVMDVYLGGLTAFKVGKTVLAPVAHFNNFVSNITATIMAGQNPAEILYRGVKGLHEKGRYFTEAQDHGLIDNDFVANETDLKNWLATMERKGVVQNVAEGHPIEAIKTTMQHASDLYQLGDSVYKMGLYSHLRDKGLDPVEATKEANKYYFDYSDVPVGVKAVRDFYIPFATYTYKALPMLAESAVKTPWRAVGVMSAIEALTAYSYATLYGDDGSQRREEEERLRPDYAKGRTFFGQKEARLPVNSLNAAGEEIGKTLNISRIMPGGNVFDIRSFGDGTTGWPDILGGSPLGGNPYLQTIAAVTMTGKDYFNKPIMAYPMDDMDNPENVKSVVKFMAEQWLPNNPLVPGSYYYQMIGNALTASGDIPPDMADKLGFTGTDRAGNQLNPLQAGAAAIGIKVHDVDTDKQRTQHARQFRALESEARDKLRSVLRSGNVSESQKDKERERFQDQIERIRLKRDEVLR